jgi:alpha-L-fucosidase
VYKSVQQIIHYLIEIVSKGGNFLLNIGPAPDGTLDHDACMLLDTVGEWLKVNGEGIFKTRSYTTCSEGRDLFYTRSKDKRILYVFLTSWPGKRLSLTSVPATGIAHVSMLGSSEKIGFVQKNNSLEVHVPDLLQKERNRPCAFAWCLKIEMRVPPS